MAHAKFVYVVIAVDFLLPKAARGLPPARARGPKHLGENNRGKARLTGKLDGADRVQTLWSLIESNEFSDIYHGMATYDPRSLAEKFKLILKGPDHPSDETDSSNLARNTAFELNLASRLRGQGFETSLAQSGYRVQTGRI